MEKLKGRFVDGYLLQKARKQLGLTQEEVAEKIGKTDKTVRRSEAGIHKIVKGREVVIASLYNIRIEDVLVPEPYGAAAFISNPNHLVQVLMHIDYVAIDIDPFVKDKIWQKNAFLILKDIEKLVKNNLYGEIPKDIYDSVYEFDKLLEKADKKKVNIQLYTERLKITNIVNQEELKENLDLCTIYLTHPDFKEDMKDFFKHKRIMIWEVYFKNVLPVNYELDRLNEWITGIKTKITPQVSIIDK